MSLRVRPMSAAVDGVKPFSFETVLGLPSWPTSPRSFAASCSSVKQGYPPFWSDLGHERRTVSKIRRNAKWTALECGRLGGESIATVTGNSACVSVSMVAESEISGVFQNIDMIAI